MGSPDPRLDLANKIDFRLKRLFSFYKKEDPPPHRVKPIPVPIIRRILELANSPTVAASASTTADMIALAFFFLLRPGEYTGTTSDTVPFTLGDVQLFLGHERLNIYTASEATLWNATFTTLTFTDQKNGVRGEVVGLGRSGDLSLCPVRSMIRRVIHLRRNGASPSTPLATYYSAGVANSVKPSDITADIRLACRFFGGKYGIVASDVNARSLRASGAMALLCSNADPCTIQLLGRWKSDAMLRYLSIQAEPVTRGFSTRMVKAGDYRLIPNQLVPSF